MASQSSFEDMESEDSRGIVEDGIATPTAALSDDTVQRSLEDMESEDSRGIVEDGTATSTAALSDDTAQRSLEDMESEDSRGIVEDETATSTAANSDDTDSDSETSASSLETEDSEEWSDEEWTDEWTPEEAAEREQFPTPPEPRLNVENAVNKTPFDYFKIFFNIIFLKKLASWINGYASVMLGRPLKAQSRIKMWKETNEKELLKFLGILFYMGTVRLNRINHYWRKTHLETFSLRNYMSRNRFLLILKMLYFTSEDVSGDIYLAVEPLIEYFNQLMREIVYPSKELVIDESMISSRGPLPIRQYIKNKRHKFAKLYFLADPHGLVHRLHMYKGSVEIGIESKGHVDKVVLKLLKPYLNAGHSVYFDNFYTSVDLAENLLSKKTFCTGPLKFNRRRNPHMTNRKKLSKGAFIYLYNRKGVCVMKWKDKRDVLTISTEHSHRMTEVVRQPRSSCSGAGSSAVTSKPVMVVQYNQFMKGIDRHDQMLSYYNCEHRSRIWFVKIGIYILQTMFMNAYFLYGQGTHKKISLEDFREKVIFKLLPPMKNTRHRRPTLPTHMPSALGRNERGCVKRKTCVWCRIQHKKRQTSGMYCPDCDVGLCLPCYRPYHVENGLLK